MQRRVVMEKRLGVITFCLLVLLVLFYRPLPAAACSCMVLPPADIALTEATAVFSGEVIAIDDSKGMDGESGKIVRFKATDVWKGVDNADISVLTGSDSAGCGIDFTIGKEYLVYAHTWDMNGKTVLSTTICDRTAELANATDDIKLIGKGTVPEQNEQTPDKNDRQYSLYIGVLFVAGLVSIFVWIRLRKTKA